MTDLLKSYLKNFKNKKIAVIGAGVSNTPLIDALLANDIETTIRDKRTYTELGDPADSFKKRGAKLRLGDEYLSDLSEDIIFRTPGLMPTNPALIEAVKRGAVLTSEIEVFFEICPCKTIAVTGSDGKTTTTSIIAQLLNNEGRTVHVGGNIGTPLLCKAKDMQASDIAVIELSSFQLITMQRSPDTAVVTNLAPNHLDVHSNMEEYIEAKSNIFKHQNQNGRAVFNLDNEITKEYAKSAPAGEKLYFSRHETVTNGVYLENGTIYEAKDGKKTSIMQVKDVFLPGMHNIENYLAAFAAVSGIVSHKTMRETAKTFRGVPHRIEFVRELRGVKYYNDSIASSPSRAIAGLRALSAPQKEHSRENKKIILIAGGKDKGVGFDEFGAEIVACVKTLVLTGMAANQIYEAVINAGNCIPAGSGKQETTPKITPEIIKCDDFADAVKTASKLATDGDIVLLSPACTSFDKFKNFEERGNTFKDIINKLV